MKTHQELTRREFFASQIAVGLFRNLDDSSMIREDYIEETVKLAVKLADLLIKELDKL